jgi:hypothetical protein
MSTTAADTTPFQAEARVATQVRRHDRGPIGGSTMGGFGFES